jgi:hypothetical protein
LNTPETTPPSIPTNSATAPAIAEEAVRYFRRNSSNAHVGLFDRKDKVFLPVDGD